MPAARDALFRMGLGRPECSYAASALQQGSIPGCGLLTAGGAGRSRGMMLESAGFGLSGGADAAALGAAVGTGSAATVAGGGAVWAGSAATLAEALPAAESFPLLPSTHLHPPPINPSPATNAAATAPLITRPTIAAPSTEIPSAPPPTKAKRRRPSPGHRRLQLLSRETSEREQICDARQEQPIEFPQFRHL